jgi:hypothetical protein
VGLATPKAAASFVSVGVCGCEPESVPRTPKEGRDDYTTCGDPVRPGRPLERRAHAALRGASSLIGYAFGSFGIGLTVIGYLFVMVTLSLVCAVFSLVWFEGREAEKARDAGTRSAESVVTS